MHGQNLLLLALLFFVALNVVVARDRWNDERVTQYSDSSLINDAFPAKAKKKKSSLKKLKKKIKKTKRKIKEKKNELKHVSQGSLQVTCNCRDDGTLQKPSSKPLPLHKPKPLIKPSHRPVYSTKPKKTMRSSR